jgi:hypothetical protein
MTSLANGSSSSSDLTAISGHYQQQQQRYYEGPRTSRPGTARELQGRYNPLIHCWVQQPDAAAQAVRQRESDRIHGFVGTGIRRSPVNLGRQATTAGELLMQSQLPLTTELLLQGATSSKGAVRDDGAEGAADYWAPAVPTRPASFPRDSSLDPTYYHGSNSILQSASWSGAALQQQQGEALSSTQLCKRPEDSR